MTLNETILSAFELLSQDSEFAGVVDLGELRQFVWTRYKIKPVELGKWLAVMQTKKKLESVIVGTDVCIVLKIKI